MRLYYSSLIIVVYSISSLCDLFFYTISNSLLPHPYSFYRPSMSREDKHRSTLIKESDLSAVHLLKASSSIFYLLYAIWQSSIIREKPDSLLIFYFYFIVKMD